MILNPADYSSAAVIAQEAGHEMLSRLDWMTLAPDRIVDVGCGTGAVSQQLQIKYPHATIISIDNVMDMLNYARQQTASRYVCADGSKLPFNKQSVDLIIANFLLPWTTDVAIFFQEWRRILKPDGMLMFTMLGLDTLKEWRSIFNRAEMPHLVDMHDVGDLLIQQGFADPVLDVCHYTTTYKSTKHLLHELKASGMWFPQNTYIHDDNINALEVSYEIIHAHAFLPAFSPTNSNGETNIPLNHLRQQLKIR